VIDTSLPKAKTSKGKKTVKAESQELAPANASRRVLYISNTHATNKVWVALGATAAAEEGIYLVAASPTVAITGYTGVVSVIASAEATVVSYSEV
jgi:hypothetical protein